MFGVATLVIGAVTFAVGALPASGVTTPDAPVVARGWSGVPAASVADAVQQAAARAAGAPAGETLILVAKTARGSFVDLPPEGESPGDFFLFEELLYNVQGERVGADSVRGDLSLTTITFEATFSIYGKGKIRIAGSLFNRDDSPFPVTGGTDAYQDVGGQLTVFELAQGDIALVFHLVR